MTDNVVPLHARQPAQQFAYFEQLLTQLHGASDCLTSMLDGQFDHVLLTRDSHAQLIQSAESSVLSAREHIRQAIDDITRVHILTEDNIDSSR